MDGAEMFAGDGAFIVGCMTNDKLAMINVFWPNAQFQRVRGDVEGHYLTTIAQHAPTLALRLRVGRRVEKFAGTASLPNYIRKPFGPGWALVGDAGYHKDPITAQGMTDAFRDAELLATAVTDGLSGARPMHEALACYQQQRDAAVMPMFEHTLQLARLAPMSPQMRQILAAMRDNQPQIDRFLGTVSGAVSPAEFFGEENVRAILEGAEPRLPRHSHLESAVA
jgi:2-polyprenyl-6-methoxyphenol hydroxylase-like FAD-dependent oxidoreductase